MRRVSRFMTLFRSKLLPAIADLAHSRAKSATANTGTGGHGFHFT